jgi:hypothetical protein
LAQGKYATMKEGEKVLAIVPKNEKGNNGHSFVEIQTIKGEEIVDWTPKHLRQIFGRKCGNRRWRLAFPIVARPSPKGHRPYYRCEFLASQKSARTFSARK